MGRAPVLHLLSVVVLATVPARAQTAAVLPPVPEMKLQFPVQPLHFSFTGAEVGNYQNGPLRVFRAESLWLQTPRLRLATFGAAERAFELDCRLTCQPVLQTVLALETRFLLPSPSAALTDTHAFFRLSTTRSPVVPNRAGLVHAGLAGAF